MNGEPVESRWVSKPQKPSLRFSVLFLLVALIQCITLSVGFIRLRDHLPAARYPLLVLVLALYVTILVAYAVFWLRKYLRIRSTERDQRVMDGGFGDQFPVEVTLSADGQCLGMDRGVLWFADGLMGFSGDATAFVLAADDLAAPWSAAAASCEDPKKPIDALVFRNAPRSGHVDVTPLRGSGKAYRRRLQRFFYDWDRPTGERFWPPLSPYEPPSGDGVPPLAGAKGGTPRLRDRLEDARPLEDDVDGGALGVRQLDQR